MSSNVDETLESILNNIYMLLSHHSQNLNLQQSTTMRIIDSMKHDLKRAPSEKTSCCWQKSLESGKTKQKKISIKISWHWKLSLSGNRMNRHNMRTLLKRKRSLEKKLFPEKYFASNKTAYPCRHVCSCERYQRQLAVSKGLIKIYVTS